jgi:hypothetical protein
MAGIVGGMTEHGTLQLPGKRGDSYLDISVDFSSRNIRPGQLDTEVVKWRDFQDGRPALEVRSDGSEKEGVAENDVVYVSPTGRVGSWVENIGQ